VLGVLLALGASLSWGCADFLGGLQTRRQPLLVVSTLSQGTGLLLMAVVVLLHHPAMPSAHDLAAAALAGLFGLAGLATFYRALAIGTMGVVAPIAATGAAVPVVAGLISGERPSALQAAGIVAAVVGVVVVSREVHDEPERRAASRRSIALAVASALLLGLFLLGLDQARHADLSAVLLTARIASVAVLVVVCLWLRPSLRQANVPPVVLTGVLDTGANGFFILATRHGLLSVVAVLSSLYPVVTAALAAVHLKERLAPSQVAGVALAVGGVALMSAG
jgi:drug/metabolite transporter (DMT)-like permease